MFCFLIPGKLIRKIDLLTKRNLAHRELLKWTKRLVLATNTPSRIPKSINLKVVLAVSSHEAGEAGGAPSPPLAPSFCTAHALHRGGERWQEAAGCTVLPSARCPHLNLNNTSIQQMDERWFMAVAGACAWSNWKGLQGLGWENFWWKKDSNLGVQSLQRHSWVRPERCWPCWVNFWS